MEKSPEAFRTISEVADWLDTPAHVLRFWESRFPEIAPVKRAGGRRYYRPEDMQLLGGIKHLLHTEGHTIKSVQERLKAGGASAIVAFSPPLSLAPARTEALTEDQDAPVANGHGTDAGPPQIPVAHSAADAFDQPAPALDRTSTDMAAPGMPLREAEVPALDVQAHGGPPTEDGADLPPIGFFFDDSDDAAPPSDQSGTFALPVPPEPEPEPEPMPAAPDATPEPVLPTAEMQEAAALLPLPDLPPDPGDAGGPAAAPVSAAAELRGLTRRDLPAEWRRHLPEIIARLERLGRGEP